MDRKEKSGILQTNQSLAPLLQPEYRLYIASRFLYIMGLRMVATIVAYKLFQLTKNSFAIGLVGLAEFIPAFVFALYAGHVIDKSDKRTLLLKGVFSYSLCVLALLAITSPYGEKTLSPKAMELSIYGIIFFADISLSTKQEKLVEG